MTSIELPIHTYRLGISIREGEARVQDLFVDIKLESTRLYAQCLSSSKTILSIDFLDIVGTKLESLQNKNEVLLHIYSYGYNNPVGALKSVFRSLFGSSSNKLRTRTHSVISFSGSDLERSLGLAGTYDNVT